jgi:hypothetical protein
MDTDIQVGDMVRLIDGGDSYFPLGIIGKVVHLRSNNAIGVEWQVSHNFGHSCKGHAKDRRGYYVLESDVEVIKRKE